MAWRLGRHRARRVVVTGLGAVTPLGNDARTTWSELLAGQSGAGPITLFDASGFVVGFACEAKDFEPTDWIERKQVRRIDRFAQLIVAAARQAEVDAALEIAKECERVGASVATAMGGLKSLEECTDTLIERGLSASIRLQSRRSSRAWARPRSRSNSARAAHSAPRAPPVRPR